MHAPGAPRAFMAGGGDMGARIRAHDWSATSLGSPDTWPQTLRSALSICLNSTFPTAIYWGPDLNLLYNDAWASIPAERHPWALGRPAREVWADIWDVIEPQFRQVMERGEGFATFDQMLAMQRGGVIEETYWNYSFTPLRDEHGHVAGVLNQGNETTAEIRMRREREEQIDRLREMFRQAPSAIGLLRGPQHVFEIANDAYIELVGGRNIIGRSVAEALPEVADQGFIALLDRVYATGEPYVGRDAVVQLRRGQQGHFEERVIDFIYQPVRGANGAIAGIFVQATDVTDGARAEASLQALNATLEQRVTDEIARRARAEHALRQSQKMEAIGQLTGGIAHDFNNMLAVVIGGLNLLRRRMDRGSTDVGQYIDGAMDGAQRAAALTQRLLAFARQQPLEPVLIDANRMLAEMTEMLERTLGEDIRVETELAADQCLVRADRNQLENALINLAVNARDAMRSGGSLKIRIAGQRADDDTVNACEQVLIEVTDTGCGMPPEVVARAFDPFFTTKPVGEGTGLGLSQVFGFVHQSGGDVSIESTPGSGTTVRIRLPRAYGDLVEQKTSHVVEVRGGTAAEIVLVVEDEPRVRLFSAEALRDLGYTVLAAANATEALRLIGEGQRANLLFTDIVMPDLSGHQLAELAQQMLPGLRVIFATGYSRDAMQPVDGHDIRAMLLLKPYTIEQLAAKVRAALDA